MLMTILLILGSALASLAQAAGLVGLWDSATTSKGGIGVTLEFRADGTFVDATTVIVNAHYRVIGHRLVVGEQPVGPAAGTVESVQIKIDGRLLRATGPDGSVVSKERIGLPEPGAPAIVGAWRYRHYTGAMAFERYAADGRMYFRLPMRSFAGRYVLKGRELSLTASNRPPVTMAVALEGDTLTLSESNRTTPYRRDAAGPWYEREHVAK
jgi:hypothetical protein